MGFLAGRSVLGAVKRVRIFYGFLVILMTIVGVRLFYLQIIQYGHYRKEALEQQFKHYEIPAERGLIEAHDGDNIVPIVLNQTLYTLYADPKYIEDPKTDAEFVASIIGGDEKTYETAMQQPNRYDILAKKLSEDTKNKLMAAKKPGLDVEAHVYRTYPDGSMAAQVLGFVNDSGNGTYGIEQALNSQLAGKPGMLKAITDVHGVPLPANGNNVDVAPVPGKNVVLTIDVPLQHQVESILKQGLKNVNSQAGCVVVLNANTGAVVAMANYPAYDPSDYAKVSDPSVFNNTAVGSQIEPGSIMKTLITAAALNEGTITPDTTYYDPMYVNVDGATIHNAETFPAGETSIKTVLEFSLNTGAVHMLETLGGGTLNKTGRDIWHDYMVNHFLFGKPTGIEQSYEASGSVPDPDHGSALNLTYANTSFGQGVSVTMLQMAAAEAAALNGGTYYQPHLVDGYVDTAGNVQRNAPKVVKRNVVTPKTSQELAGLMEFVFTNNHVYYRSNLHDGYNIGGKTGTAQVAQNGSYLPDVSNGTFIGFVGGDKPQYVIDVFTKRPQEKYVFAGTGAAPIFGGVVDALVNSGRVTPQS